MSTEQVLENLPDRIIDSLRGPTSTSTSTYLMIPGKPTAKGRPKFTLTGRVYTPKHTQTAEKQVKVIATNQHHNPQFKGPVVTEILAIFGIPVSWPKKKRLEALAGIVLPAVKPDFDNLMKLYCDALNGILWKDDKQIVDGRCIKCYGEKPAVIIWCWPV